MNLAVEQPRLRQAVRVEPHPIPVLDRTSLLPTNGCPGRVADHDQSVRVRVRDLVDLRVARRTENVEVLGFGHDEILTDNWPTKREDPSVTSCPHCGGSLEIVKPTPTIGGGGGGGGLVVVVSGSVSAGAISGQTIDAAAGAGGGKTGTGVAGTNGTGGTVILIPN